MRGPIYIHMVKAKNCPSAHNKGYADIGLF